MASFAADIMNRVRFLLHDKGFAGGERFSDTDIYSNMTAALHDIALRKPMALAIRDIFQLDPGTEQLLPANGYMFIGGLRNYGTNGTTVGSAITTVDMDVISRADPNWQLATADDVVIHTIQDSVRPEAFYVYPPQPALSTGYIEAAFIPEIAPISDGGDVLPTRPLLDNALVAGTAFRCIMGDSESDANASLAKSIFEAYLEALKVG